MKTIETKLLPIAKVLEQYVPVKKSCKGFSTSEDVKEALELLAQQFNDGDINKNN